MSLPGVESLPETIDFPKEEEKVMKLWKEIDAFRSCLKQSKGKPRYTFYDGPPFATGLPHYGHILAGTIKDIVTRYAHQSGYHVERRFGWDTHGLPVEYEIDKTLGIKGSEDVEKMGIAAYNAECRKIVMRYAKEWQDVISRLGRWIDFENDYKTLYPSFMESVWWVFKQLFSKGLVYRGFKVMPFSTACHTPLSNFESGQNYKEVVDPAVMVSFPLDDEPDVSLVAWTTTPWTLPSNLALCLNPSLDYVKVTDRATGKVYVLMEARLEALYKDPDEYEILKRFKASALKDKTYKPLFPYYEHLKKRGAFRVLIDDYVTEESGTGVVHQAPYFGEDDYQVALREGVITVDMDMVCPVDDSGRFTHPVTDFEGQYVKDADKGIIAWLKTHGRLVHVSQVKHSYPFCWRSETPLIYRAVPSWFIRVAPMVNTLLQTNQETYWVPDFVKEKRFGNWLRDARDWAVSRNRYWGTPIPIWMSDDGQEVICIGSIAELEQLTGQKIADLHRENVDNLTIPSSRPGHPPLRRISEVFDCWFESGSMPYAQSHYPFEKQKEFEDSFPADFIAEGLDQTRGWFYTLLVISTLLFGKPPFKNLIVNGLVLAADGQKMSKSKKNFPDPMVVVHKYGADALRLYLINSPVVRAESLRFKEDGVRDVLKDVFLPWYNAFRFLMQNIKRLEQEEGKKFECRELELHASTNPMDHWILSFTQSLLAFFHKEMGAYCLYTVVPQLVKFVDNLTNWYVRMNRRRLKGEMGLEDCHHALRTLYSVLYSMVRVMAPFTPFLTETMYQAMRQYLDESLASVHYLMIPKPRESLINIETEWAVSCMQRVIELGRVIRDRKTLPVKYPLPEVVVIHRDQRCLDAISNLEMYVKAELNVKRLTTSTDKEKYGVHLRAEPDHKVLGQRLKSAFKAIVADIKELGDDVLQEFLQTGKLILQGQELGHEDLRIMYAFDNVKAGAGKYEAHADSEMLVLLDVSPDQSMMEEGIAREVINRIQKLRKKGKLMPSDMVTVFYAVTPSNSDLHKIIPAYLDVIESTTKGPVRPMASKKGNEKVLIREKHQLKGSELELVITQGLTSDSLSGGKAEAAMPYTRYVMLESLEDGRKGMILLENPLGSPIISYFDLMHAVREVFGLQKRPFHVYPSLDSQQELQPNDVSESLSGQTLYVEKVGLKHHKRSLSNEASPPCRYVNVEHKGQKGTLLLENPQEEMLWSPQQLKMYVSMLFLIPPEKLQFGPLPNKENIFQLHQKTIHVQ